VRASVLKCARGLENRGFWAGNGGNILIFGFGEVRGPEMGCTQIQAGSKAVAEK
jgi:hypothetical protein